MSREIKFRAWDRRSMKWFDMQDFALVPPNIHVTIPGIGGPVIIPADQYELMQYTGLRTKSGVEIYEGDIIRICHYEPFDEDDPDDKPEYSTHEVKWGDLAWVVNPTYSEEYNDLGMVGEGWEDGHLWMEVIGNIYENPDLLTTAK